MPHPLPMFRGRGCTSNRPNCSERIDFAYLHALARPQPTYLVDRSKTIVTTNDSPEVGLTDSVNPFRGRSLGCGYERILAADFKRYDTAMGLRSDRFEFRDGVPPLDIISRRLGERSVRPVEIQRIEIRGTFDAVVADQIQVEKCTETKTSLLLRRSSVTCRFAVTPRHGWRAFRFSLIRRFVPGLARMMEIRTYADLHVALDGKWLVLVGNDLPLLDLLCDVSESLGGKVLPWHGRTEEQCR